MTLPEQTAVLLEAAEQGLLNPKTLVHWADGVIGSQASPPYWLIELSTLNSDLITDFLSILGEQAVQELSIRCQVQIILAAYEAEQLELVETLRRLFQTVIIKQDYKSPRDALDETLRDALVDWDFLENPRVIDVSLQQRLHDIFRIYLADADEVRSLLGWTPRRSLS